ncbi:beta/gamma crystallin family protein [Aquabacterium sp. OR-4]|uniref:beta/gamma crystallin family protein n=1 Tax=Aquabacterium sp. OR-4 TaxID=2978127 RepID=UPI0021B1EF78|nr:beta/gamma crystallin family protein [Aquabacterium sp. OR-4]MDT7836730.1 beta/gamma crystallin family protein [Aquabacterium sp. OR-4]
MNLRHPTALRGARRLLALIALAGLQAAAHAELVLYEHDDYGGRQFSTRARSTPDLAAEGFNDRASSAVVRSGRWQLCTDAEFRGQCITLSAGSYPSLRGVGLNDSVSSVRELGDWGGGWAGRGDAIELYEHDDLEGQRLGSNSPVVDLARRDFNDRASSVLIRSGRWDLCSDADFRGRCVTLGPGRYTQLRDQGLNDAVSSLRPSSGPPAWGGGRPNGGWHNDDGSVPEITLGIQRYGRATFSNGCVVYYNPAGQRLQNLPSCDGRQIRRADESMSRYRADQGLDRPEHTHPWSRPRPPGGLLREESAPEIFAGNNREAEVVFRDNCIVYYAASGRRWRQLANCTPEQLRRADAAMASFRRAQGW